MLQTDHEVCCLPIRCTILSEWGIDVEKLQDFGTCTLTVKGLILVDDCSLTAKGLILVEG